MRLLDRRRQRQYRRNFPGQFRIQPGGCSHHTPLCAEIGPEVTGAAAFPGFAVTTPYFLFVGSLEARKNIVGTIEAFRLSGLVAKGYQLLIVGGRAHGAEEIEQKAAMTDGVVLCGFLSDAEKIAAYAGATGFVYPSYLEGFGIPLLEAMAFGIPSVTTVTGASPEIGEQDGTHRLGGGDAQGGLPSEGGCRCRSSSCRVMLSRRMADGGHGPA
jgi:glycosyltransferase involved in cell wall biosynthesis